MTDAEEGEMLCDFLGDVHTEIFKKALRFEGGKRAPLIVVAFGQCGVPQTMSNFPDMESLVAGLRLAADVLEEADRRGCTAKLEPKTPAYKPPATSAN